MSKQEDAMNIKEVEKQTGIKKANIRYYEDAGLITAERNSVNNYREYSSEDIEFLKKVRLLRALDISIPDIKRLHSGSVSLDQVLAARLEKLEQEKERLDTVGTLCRRLQEEHTDFENLDVSIADNDRLWTEQMHKIMQFDKVPGIMNQQIKDFTGYSCVFVGLMDIVNPDFNAEDRALFLFIYMTFLVVGLIITFRNDLYIYRTYGKNFFLADISWIFLFYAYLYILRDTPTGLLHILVTLTLLTYVYLCWYSKQKLSL